MGTLSLGMLSLGMLSLGMLSLGTLSLGTKKERVVSNQTHSSVTKMMKGIYICMHI